ncbi:MAG: hypothetical protein QXX99_08035 [Candidatus Bathyarchaeia archaeon]
MEELKPKIGVGVVLGKNVRLGAGAIIWNYVIMRSNMTILNDKYPVSNI